MNRTLSQRQIIAYSAFLILLGAGWAFTQPMSKIAVSEGYKHFGLIFWQFVIGAVVMAVVSMIRRRGLPMGQNHLRLYLIIAVIGTLLARRVGKHHKEYYTTQVEHGGILLWVRVRDKEQEDVAVKIMKEHSGRDVHVHPWSE